MSPQDVEAVYNDLSQVPQQTADQAIGEIGASQAAQGPSAAAMGASGGSGIGDYTYNRLVDPAVQQLRTQLVSTGRSEALNRAINLALQQAQERYRNAYNSYANRPSGSGGGGGGNGGGGNGGDGTITGVDETVVDDSVPGINSDTDVRLNYDENGNLISASLPNTDQDIYVPGYNAEQLGQAADEKKRQELINKWKEQHPFTPVPDFINNYGG